MNLRRLINNLQLAKRAKDINQRAKQNNAPGIIGEMVLVELIIKSGGQCQWCGQPFEDAEDVEIEHVFPFRLNGTNQRDNLVIACTTCNRHKAEKHPAKFAQEQAAKGIETPLIIEILSNHNIDRINQSNLFD